MNNIDFDKLKNSSFYYEYMEFGRCDYTFDEFLLSIMIMKENNEYFKYYVKFVKKIKEITGLGLAEAKDYCDIIKNLGFIIVEFNKPTIITDFIFEINSSMDIINMIKYNMNINMFLRKKKINKLIGKL